MKAAYIVVENGKSNCGLTHKPEKLIQEFISEGYILQPIESERGIQMIKGNNMIFIGTSKGMLSVG